MPNSYSPPPPDCRDQVCPLQSWGTRPGIRPHPISAQLPNQVLPFNFGTLIKVYFGALDSAIPAQSVFLSLNQTVLRLWWKKIKCPLAKLVFYIFKMHIFYLKVDYIGFMHDFKQQFACNLFHTTRAQYCSHPIKQWLTKAYCHPEKGDF